MKTVGIVGYGGMGKHHAGSMAEVEGIQVKAVHDVNAKRLELAQENGLLAYESIENFLADDEIEIVIVATPNNFHKENCIAALRAGKHVICEKPVMMNAQELVEVQAIALECGRLFSVHQNRRWDEDFLIVKKVIEDGTIGTPYYIESRVQGAKGVPGDWRCAKGAGGGMLLDWGIHLIDQIIRLDTSPIVEIYAHLLTVKFCDVDDNFKIMFKFESGTSGFVEVDTNTFINLPRWHVSGTDGTMVVSGWDCSGQIAKSIVEAIHLEESIVITAAGPTKTMAPRPVGSVEHLPLPRIESDSRDYYKNFIATIDGREDLLVKPEESLRLMKIIDAIFESAQRGEVVKGKY
ncbi:MAG: Gfo/Idh/MocA family oxidoreductase [Bacillota bacterium]